MSGNQFEYSIEGSDLQFVELKLAPGAKAVGEPGSMMYMDDAIQMDTVLGDGADEGFFARIGGAFKRMFTGESMFSTLFINPTDQPLRVAFAAPSPGKIVPIDLEENGGAIICQKGAFLGGTQGVRVGIAFKKRLRVGFFGGEGFIMQKLTGNGIAFVHASGTLTEQTLGPNDSLKVDTGCLAALQTSATYDIRYVGKMKSALFGGEGLFFAHLKGPGQVWLQSLPVQRLARGLFAHALSGRGRSPLGRVYLILIVIFALFTLFADLGTQP
jgi:uncharacterized protein (TIGR00266 family)